MTPTFAEFPAPTDSFRLTGAVNRHDMAQGVGRNCEACPLAVAIKRVFAATYGQVPQDVYVSGTITIWATNSGWVAYPSESLKIFMARFDSGDHPKGIPFDLRFAPHPLNPK